MGYANTAADDGCYDLDDDCGDYGCSMRSRIFSQPQCCYGCGNAETTRTERGEDLCKLCRKMVCDGCEFYQTTTEAYGQRRYCSTCYINQRRELDDEEKYLTEEDEELCDEMAWLERLENTQLDDQYALQEAFKPVRTRRQLETISSSKSWKPHSNWQPKRRIVLSVVTETLATDFGPYVRTTVTHSNGHGPRNFGRKRRLDKEHRYNPDVRPWLFINQHFDLFDYEPSQEELDEEHWLYEEERTIEKNESSWYCDPETPLSAYEYWPQVYGACDYWPKDEMPPTRRIGRLQFDAWF